LRKSKKPAWLPTLPKAKQQRKSFLIPTEVGKTMSAVNGICTQPFGGASYSVQSGSGLKLDS